MKKLFFLICFVSYIQVTYSQGQMTSPVPENFLSTSPDVTAFQKYNALPVSLYTGKIDLSIPIFTIESGDISVPISISYNSGGIKVDDYASSVGLGWNLNAGGNIIRDIKDLPDNEAGFRFETESDWDVGLVPYDLLGSLGYNRNGQCVNDTQIHGFSYSPTGPGGAWYTPAVWVDELLYQSPTNNIITASGSNFPGYGTHQEDLSPDLFYASAPGLNSTFTSTTVPGNCFYSNNNANFNSTFIRNSGAKMKSIVVDSRVVLGQGFETNVPTSVSHLGRTQHPIKDFFEFNIINNNGLKYKFADEEVFESFYYPLGSTSLYVSANQWINAWITMSANNYNKRISTWNLTTIKDDKTNKVVSFDYDTYVNSNSQRNTFTNGLTITPAGSQVSPGLYDASECYFGLFQNPGAPYNYTDAYKSLERHIKRKRLTKITFDKGEVLFIYGINRQDYTGEKALTEIQIKNQQGTIIKKFKFNYSYFNSKENCAEQECKRLRLDSVDMLSANNSNNGSYVFDYEYTNKLPKRGSLQQDYLGYYNNNGITGNTDATTTYKPKLYYYKNQGKYSVLPFQKTNATAQIISGQIDLTPNSYSLTGVLKKVTFPTGGTTEFEYENNKFQFQGVEYVSGGGRVKTQTLKDNGNIVKELHYEYKESDGKTSGYINNIPVYGYIQYFKNSYPYTAYSFNVYDKPKSGIELTTGSYVGYSKVKEYEVNNGYTEYLYKSPKDEPNTSEVRSTLSQYPYYYSPPTNNISCVGKFINNSAYPSSTFINNDYKRSKIARKSVYDQLNTLLLKEEYDYTTRVLNDLSLQKNIKLIATDVPTASDPWTPSLQYLFDVTTNLPTAQNLTTHKKTTEYFNGSPKTTDEYFTYDDNYPFLKETNVSGSVDVLKTTVSYPFDSDVSSLPQMSSLIAQNRLSTPIKEEYFVNGNLSSGSLINYKDFGNGMILPKSLSKTLKESTNLDEGAIIDLRDDNGNILQYHNKANVYYSIIWGYDKQYPVAKIENATYASIQALSGFGTNFTIANALSATQEITLRGLTNAMVTTYTYKPLVGITSIKDPKGYKMTYIYDEFNRLEFVKNANGKILSKNEYNYKKLIAMKTIKNYTLVGSIFITLFSSLALNAQFLVPIIGDNSVSVNDIETYQVNATGTTIFSGIWSVSSGGTVQSQNATSATIQWTTSGMKTIRYKGSSSIGKVSGIFDVTVGSASGTPTMPPNPVIVTQSCTSAVLQKNGAIPTGISWYWQGTSSNGTSTSLSAINNYTVTSSGTYYLRARNSSGTWSLASGNVSVTLGTTGGPTWYEDSDGDGLGDPNSILVHCSQPTGYVSNNNDACPGTNGGGSTNGCVGGAMNNENYIYTITPRKEVTDISQLTENKDALKNITYFDGLGRAKQSIAIKQSPSEKDIITHIAYDEFGRQPKEYLSYAKTNQDGFFRPNALSETNIFYDTPEYENTQNPFSEKAIESSPLGRVFEQAAPGEDWKLANNHTIKFDYATNHATEVRYFGVGFVNKDFLQPFLTKGKYSDYYPYKSLYKNIIKDENWQPSDGVNHTTEEFKDIQGRVVLKRTYNNSEPHDTYYVYDHFGSLTFVIPPLVDIDNLFTEVLTPITYDTSVVSTYPVSLFTFNGGSGQATARINSTSGGGYEYEIDFNFTSLNPPFKNQLFRYSPNIQLPFSGLLPNTTMFTAAGISNFNLTNGILNIVQDINATPIPISSLYETYTYSLPTNAVSYVADTSILDKLCYQYIYDNKNRLVEKKIPGKGWESIVYNESNLPILTQDSNLKLQNKWLFTKYDAFGRTAYTGIMNNSNTRESLQTTVDGVSSQYVTKRTTPTTIAGTTIYYNNGAYPTSISEIYTISYYDNYTFDKGAGTSESSYGITPITNAKGLSTGLKVRVLDSSPVKWITTVSYFDDKSRSIYVYNNNAYLNATDKVKSKFDFIGQVDEITTQHTKSSSTITTIEKNYYDHAGRTTKHTQTIDGNEEVIVENMYDNLGQLKSKGVGGKIFQNRLETVNYKYNVRGWLKEINDVSNTNSLFSFKINYNQSEMTGSTNLFNGNISETLWRTNSDAIKRGSNYQYDDLNRIQESGYGTGEILNSELNRYRLHDVSYDKNGNIITLKREGHTAIASGVVTAYGQMDDLAYDYVGNQLEKVEDTAATTGFKNGANTPTEFTYDSNGNMLTDLNKGISSDITYNYLNLPTLVTLPTGNIQYVYDAVGTKLKKVVNESGASPTNTEYAGNYMYKDSSLEFFNQPEGYVET